MRLIILAMLVSIFPLMSWGQNDYALCKATYGGMNIFCDSASELARFKKYGARTIKNCFATYGFYTDCAKESDLDLFEKFGNVIRKCFEVYGEFRGPCHDEKGLSRFAAEKGLEPDYIVVQRKMPKVIFDHLKQVYPLNQILECIDVKGHYTFCDQGTEMASYSKYGKSIVQRCMNLYQKASQCDEDMELDFFKQYPESVIQACLKYHSNDISRCDQSAKLKQFSEMEPLIDACYYIAGEKCAECANYQGVKKFMDSGLQDQVAGLNYFKIGEFFDISIRPACSVYQLELLPEYNKYSLKMDAKVQKLATCENRHLQSNKSVKGLLSFLKKLTDDLKYTSLYKGTLTDDSMKAVFMKFVKGHAKQSKLSDKVKIDEMGISYKDDQVEVALNYHETIDKDGNKTNVLHTKSLVCEKKHPFERKLSYEEFRDKYIPSECLVFNIKEEKMKKDRSVKDSEASIKKSKETKL